MIMSGVLDPDAGARHAFFTRSGGVSEGLFGSLNCGFGSGDSSEKVARNREIAMDRLGLPADRLVTCRQIHSVAVVTVGRPWRREEAPRADGLVTAVPGVALGVLTADCAPILMHDPFARVIGAAHGGWRGALCGIIEATIGRMVTLGAECSRVRAAIGPRIGPQSYEVGPEFRETFLSDDPGSSRWFALARREGHFLFDLASYLAHRLARSGVVQVEITNHDTVTEEDRFFSYRRACLHGERAYGRGLSAIALAE
jgi:YfiH family protein